MAFSVAFYDMPFIRHRFIVLRESFNIVGKFIDMEKKDKRRKYFEHALDVELSTQPSAYDMRSSTNPNLTILTIWEDDFLKALESFSSTLNSLSWAPIEKPEDINLLAMNSLQTIENLTNPLLAEPKILSKLGRDDIIEVFI